ncbi:ribosome-associated protein [Scopulibacillus darangshiensis]|uniref:Ribosomal silencing factor RsfS n=1 Tax=Scopulibacillus darangshiensis TaxID=442528 RepID=A0A4R2PB35_9BACL|nr:ribosome silencing factor [Scopulibacillus darangshiensis]TCP32319.1 ribosome-associated protein [Scopulibacillus darangshiensis]
MHGEQLLNYVAEIADDKKAHDPVILNMQGISVMADYFMICHGNSEKQVQAIARGLKEAAAEKDIPVRRMEGYDQARWVLVDMGDVIIHIFHRDERDYYKLEKLWGDAPMITVENRLL